MEIIGVIIGFLAGGVLVWLVLKASGARATGMVEDRIAELVKSNDALNQEVDELRDENIDLAKSLAVQQESNRNLKLQHEESEKILLERFENLANEILDRKSQKFTDQNEKNIGSLLGPLKEKIEKFEQKVEKSSQESLKWNTSLKTQIEGLAELNKRINKEAENLTRALTGDSKTQGDWGEMQLELLLEKAGLVKGVHFTTQGGFRDEEGQLKKPDFIINLPEGRNLIIDSKVSLTAYERYSSAEDDADREAFLKEHLKSVREKIKDLNSKNYQELHGIHAPDYVMMYIPVEPAYLAAVLNDNNLYFDALDKNIVLVSSSTLLATMRTVSYIWTQEDQSRHVKQIAEQSGALYDKFVGFTEDLIRVGNAMDKAKSEYKGAMNKLSTGTGNLVRRVEKIKKLGAKASKSLDSKLIERAEDLIEESNDNENNSGS